MSYKKGEPLKLIPFYKSSPITKDATNLDIPARTNKKSQSTPDDTVILPSDAKIEDGDYFLFENDSIDLLDEEKVQDIFKDDQKLILFTFVGHSES